ncbi:MAG: C-GCAxxG-C-C family protein [Ruminiclostridium sp.]
MNNSKADKASELFSNNFNCSQAVLTAFAPDFGLDEQLALRLGTSFGGGARNGEICGAVSGALLVLGLKYGHYISTDNRQKSRAYEIAADYTRRFKEVNGSIVCRELLGYDLTKPDEMACIKEKGLFGDVCPKMIKSAVEILESVLAEYE